MGALILLGLLLIALAIVLATTAGLVWSIVRAARYGYVSAIAGLRRLFLAWRLSHSPPGSRH